jgi:hypothetical protein
VGGLNQPISSAVGEKLAALMTEDYLARAGRGSRRSYEAVLSQDRGAVTRRRQVAGAAPTMRLKARLKAASES